MFLVCFFILNWIYRTFSVKSAHLLLKLKKIVGHRTRLRLINWIKC